MKRFNALLFACAITLAGCSKQASTDEDSTDPGTGSGALVNSNLVGTHWGTCVNVTGGSYGTSMDGGSFLPAIYFSAGGSYHLDFMFFSSTNCQIGGGEEVWAYTQFGTYSLGTTTVSGMTPIAFVTSSSNNGVMTNYASSSPTNGPTWAGYFNTYCGSSPGFSTSADQSKYVQGKTCFNAASPSINLPTFPANSATYTNLISLDSTNSPTTITMGAPDNRFTPGVASGSPTTSGLTFTF